MDKVRVQRIFRVLATMALPIAVAILSMSPSSALAQQSTRPLGVLINSTVDTQPRVGSVLPSPSTITNSPRQTTGITPAESNSTSSRPLGSLISVPSTPAANSSVLPQNWNQTPRRETNTSPVLSPTRTAQPDGSRPLGTLFNDPNRRTATRSVLPQSTGPTLTPHLSAPNSVSVQSTNSQLDKEIDGPRFVREQPSKGVFAPSSGLFAAPSNGNNNEDVIPADLTADSMTYDRELGLITATGNVQITYGQRLLIADKITYNQKTGIVQALGNASLTEDNGEVLLGDRFDITGDLKDGVIYNIGLVLADRSRVAGSGARRSNGIKTEVSNAVYSPCNLCEEDPEAAPLWQLKAVRVIHNAEEKRVEYRDAWLEVFGVPVAYTPYLSHPDPTVKRRSGLLAPSFSSSSELGFRIETPFFWAIDDYQDATITPLITTGGSGSILEYNRNFEKGIIRANGSFVFNDPDQGERAYIDFESEYHFNNTWRAGLDVETASDDTYTRRYGFDTDSVLESRAYLEGFKGKNYQSVNAYAFTDLRSNSESRNSPIILPIYDFNYVGNRDRLGGFASFDFNALNLMRNSGDGSTRRLSLRPRWDRPFRGNYGELYNASVSLAADAYHSSNVVQDDETEFTGLAGRFLPRASLSWRLPLIRPGTTFNNTIEPIIKFVAAPNVGNTTLIPNEDSPEIEFDETNLLSDNLFDGIDRVEGGMRASYGLNWVVTGKNDGSASFFLGQAYRPREDSNFGPGSGLNDKFSDIIGRAHFRPNKFADITYRTQLSSDDIEVQRNELSGTVGPSALQATASYIFIGQQPGSEFEGREELNTSLSSQINENLRANFSSLYDVEDADLRSLGLQVVYEDECVKFTSQLTRSFFEDRDLRPEDRVSFTIVLKTLGEFTTGVF
jgi:LPS-assembly protein